MKGRRIHNTTKSCAHTALTEFDRLNCEYRRGQNSIKYKYMHVTLPIEREEMRNRNTIRALSVYFALSVIVFGFIVRPACIQLQTHVLFSGYLADDVRVISISCSRILPLHLDKMCMY